MKPAWLNIECYVISLACRVLDLTEADSRHVGFQRLQEGRWEDSVVSGQKSPLGVELRAVSHMVVLEGSRNSHGKVELEKETPWGHVIPGSVSCIFLRHLGVKSYPPAVPCHHDALLKFMGASKPCAKASEINIFFSEVVFVTVTQSWLVQEEMVERDK